MARVQYNLVSVSSLALFLVFFTAFGVAFAAKWWLPGFNWQLGFLLGAVVSPTDAVAATSIARKVGMPQRVVDLLEGESLLNDANRAAGSAVRCGDGRAGNDPNRKPRHTRNSSGWTLGGLLVGLVIGWGVTWLERWLDDGPVEIALSLIVAVRRVLDGGSGEGGLA